MMMEKRGWDGGRTRMDGSRSAEGDSRRVYEKRLCINKSYLLDNLLQIMAPLWHYLG